MERGVAGTLYKRGKFGCLPGDIPKWAKIRMLEDRRRFWLFPWQLISAKSNSAFRDDHYKKNNRRFRKGGKRVERGYIYGVS